jgi:hypothetical protein
MDACGRLPILCRDTDVMDSTLAMSLIQFTNAMATVSNRRHTNTVGYITVYAGFTGWHADAEPNVLIITCTTPDHESL